MSTALNPAYQSIVIIKSSIQNALKSGLPPDILPGVIAPLLSTINQWSSQIPIMLTETGVATSTNLVFAIRKELFIAPQFTRNVLNTPLEKLPTAFQEFQSFIHKLIDAQKGDQPAPKVRLVGSQIISVALLVYAISLACKMFHPHRKIKVYCGR